MLCAVVQTGQPAGRKERQLEPLLGMALQVAATGHFVILPPSPLVAAGGRISIGQKLLRRCSSSRMVHIHTCCGQEACCVRSTAVRA